MSDLTVDVAVVLLTIVAVFQMVQLDKLRAEVTRMATLIEIPPTATWRARDLPLTSGITATSTRPYQLRCPTCKALSSAVRADHVSGDQDTVLRCAVDQTPLQVVRVIGSEMFQYYTPTEMRP
jgi:hypothetical protein